MTLIATLARGVTRCACPNVVTVCANGFNTTSARHLDQEWRSRKGLTKNPNNFGPLTNMPDYSFKDGRPTPLGRRLTTRLNKQRDYAAKILKLAGEIDFAVDRHNKLVQAEAAKRQEILDNKLKPKGHLLLKK